MYNIYIMEKALSKKEVEKIAGKKVKVITVPELQYYNNLEEIMKDNKNVLLLYQDYHDDINRIKSGHWTVLKELDPENIAFYCSYGMFPDDQLKHIPKKYREQTQQVKKNLSRLLYNSKYKKIHYNPHKHQKKGLGINTCGRHAGLFMYMNQEPEKYNKLIKYLSKVFNMNTDELSVFLTDYLL